VVNGPAALAYDLSKARQLSLFARAGLSVPRTRIAHRLEDLPILAAEVGYPVMIKVNVGGSGAGMTRYSDAAELSAALAAKTTPVSVDGVLLVQAFIPARNGQVFRCEVLDGRLLYAIALSGAGSTFDLCPADVCMIDKPTISIQAHHPAPDIRAAAERVARAAHLDVGGLEYMIDDQTGEALFYDLNALSNFVAKPQDVLGFDPHEPLVDYLMGAVANVRKAAA
jgi:biotin carboxylase